MVSRIAKVKSKAVKTACKALPYGAVLKCADNTGAQLLRVIAVAGFKGKRRRYPACGVGDFIWCSVIKGAPDIRKTVVQAIVIRQRKEYSRPDGSRVKFEDNAAIVVTIDGDLKGTEIKGAVAKEAINKWPSIASAVSIVV